MIFQRTVIAHIFVKIRQGIAETAVDLVTAYHFVCLFVIIFAQVVYLHTE